MKKWESFTTAANGPAGTAERPLFVALVAHDSKKHDLVRWVQQHREFFSTCKAFATGTTGQRILEACPELSITRLKSGPLGGDQQLGAMICEGKIDLLFFFVDPLTAMPHDVDVKALMRLALVYDIPAAYGERTAELLIAGVKTPSAPSSGR